MCICCRIDVDVLLILPTTMHINVLYFVLFSFFPVGKGFSFFCIHSIFVPLKKSGVERRNVEKSRCCYEPTIHINTFRDIQMGFPFFLFPLPLFFLKQALKWIHLHLVSGLRFTIQGKNFFVPFAKNEICYALIKWSCCTFFVRFILKILSFILILKTTENVNVNEKKIIG